MRKSIFLLILILINLMEISAQNNNADLARFTILVPKDGMQKQFDDGYKRHLQWHVDNGDKWNWYGWYIVSGKRFGYFVDATFGRSWAEFDQPVNPAKDVADLAINVAPSANVFTQFTCTHLRGVSKGDTADLSADLPQLISFKIKPGQELNFEKFLAGFHKDWQKIEPEQNYLWYRVEDGQEAPQYLLLLPHKSSAEKQKSQNFLARLWLQNTAAQAAFQASVSEMSSEIMRYRADMTFIPK